MINAKKQRFSPPGSLFSSFGGAHDIIFGSKFARRSRDERRHHFLEPLEKKTNHEQKIVKHGKHTQHFFHGTQKTWCHAKNNGVCGMKLTSSTSNFYLRSPLSPCYVGSSYLRSSSPLEAIGVLLIIHITPVI
jgi:hypothetical protein